MFFTRDKNLYFKNILRIISHVLKYDDVTFTRKKDLYFKNILEVIYDVT